MALEALNELKSAIEVEVPDVNQVQQALHNLAHKVGGRGPEPRQEIIDADGYNIIVRAWKYFCNTGENNVRVLTPEAELIREASLKAMYRLSTGFPQIIDEFGFIMIVQGFYNLVLEPTKIYALKFMRNICIKNEMNREKLAFEYNIAEPFVHLIKVDHPSSELVREWCGVLRAFTLSDDPTVTHNRAVERKRLIYQNQGHHYLCQFLKAYIDGRTLNSVIQALAILATNEDFCVAIESSGGLSGLSLILETYTANIQLMKNAISCLRYLFMSSIVREKGGSTTIVKMVIHLAWENRDYAEFVRLALSCLGFLTIRNPCACAQLLYEKGVEFIIEIMKMYIDLELPSILKSGCLTLRNISAIGGKIGKATINELDGANLIREIGEKYPDLIVNHVNPLLRDLGFPLLAQPLATGEENLGENDDGRSNHPRSSHVGEVGEHHGTSLGGRGGGTGTSGIQQQK